MTPEASLFPPVVFTLWWTGLLVTLILFVPFAVYLLHDLWRTARSIQIYAAESLAAAAGIAGNTQHIPALDSTIQIATEILTAAGSIEKKVAIVADVLAARAGRL